MQDFEEAGADDVEVGGLRDRVFEETVEGENAFQENFAVEEIDNYAVPVREIGECKGT